MLKYEITHACGHIATHDLIGKQERRDYKIAQLTNSKCEACIESKNQEILNSFEQDYGLPLLEGSEKQIAWARKIRKAFLESINSHLLKADARIPGAVEELKRKRLASFWIDHRELTPKVLVITILKDLEDKVMDLRLQELIEKATQEIILTPVEHSDICAEIKLVGSRVEVHAPKSEEMIDYMKENQFIFDGDCWGGYGDEDLAAQVADALLEMNISAVLHNPIAREKLFNRTYKRTSPRIIDVTLYKDEPWFELRYPYSPRINTVVTQNLRGRFKGKHYRVPRNMYMSVEPFAEEFDFVLTDRAKELIEILRNRVTLIVNREITTIKTDYAEPGIIADLVDTE